jgi:hypothetical protein
VSGRVAFPDGRPLPGVEVTDGGGRPRARTDESGRYVVSGVARGPVDLACAVAHHWRTVEAGAGGGDFVVKQSVARVRFLDARGRPFRYADTALTVTKDGVLLDRNGGSSRADGVEFMEGPTGARVLAVATGAAGEFGRGSATFDDVPRLHDVDVVVSAASPRGALRLVVRTDAPEFPRSVYATVIDELDQTVAGGWRTRCDLDPAASVEFPNVPAGRVWVAVAPSALRSRESLGTFLVRATPVVDVEVGRTTEVVATLVVGGRVRATVRDESGSPVAPRALGFAVPSDAGPGNEFVRLRPGQTWTTDLDTSPSVLVDAVRPGRYVVVAEGPSGEKGQKEFDVVRGATVDVEVVVKAVAK